MNQQSWQDHDKVALTDPREVDYFVEQIRKEFPQKAEKEIRAAVAWTRIEDNSRGRTHLAVAVTVRLMRPFVTGS